MDVRITSRHGTAPKEVREYAEEKLSPLGRYNRHATVLDVVLDVDHLLKTIEVKAHLDRGAPLVIHSKHEDWHAAIDLAHDKAESTLRRMKERLDDRRHRGAPTPEERLAEAFRTSEAPTADLTDAGELVDSGERDDS